MKQVMRLVVIVVIVFTVGGVATASSPTDKTLTVKIAVQNLDLSASSTVVIDYYTEDTPGAPGGGGSAGSPTPAFSLLRGRMHVVNLSEEGALPSFRGSAVAASDKDIGAVVNVLALNQTPTSSGAYISMPPSNEWYLPAIYRQSPSSNGAWTTEIVVQNAESTPTTVDIEFFRQDGTPEHTETETIEPNASFYCSQLDMATELPSVDPPRDYWYGTAKVTTDGGMVVVAASIWADHELLIYNGFSTPANPDDWKEWVAPYIARRLPAPQDWSTPWAAMNVSDATAQIYLTYRAAPTYPNYPQVVQYGPQEIPPWGLWGENPRLSSVPSGLPTSWWGSLTITSTQPIVLTVNEMRQSDDSAMNYNGIPTAQGTNTAFAPYIQKYIEGGWSTTWTIVNVDPSGEADVWVEYLTKGTEEVIRVPESGYITVPYLEPWGQNNRLNDPNWSGLYDKSDWIGSVVVHSNKKIVAIANQLNDIPSGDGYMSYNMIGRQVAP